MPKANEIIDKFGGQSALAKLIGKRQSTVQHWCSAGIIPARWQNTILKLAEENGIPISPRDFMTSTTEEAIENNIVAPAGIIPEAKWPGFLKIADIEVPVYVLNDGRRVISRGGATSVLTSDKGGGNLEQYINVLSLKEYMPLDIPDKMINFTMKGVVNKTILGIEADTFIEICQAYVKALDAGALTTKRQMVIAFKASMFLSGCAKVGINALIDEATGYQYEREDDALQFKLKLYLEEEMRKWEKTFPNELWDEFGRLTQWNAPILSQRPKYWGKLIMELVYEYLDKDVADWLRDNAPKPQKGQNYHQWLTSQYGLKKLIEHIWMLIGVAKSCESMMELRDKMARLFGRERYQLSLFLPPPRNLNKPKIPKRSLLTDLPPGENNQI